MGRNGRQSPARPRIEIAQAAASSEEAAAIAAALEQFLHETTPLEKPKQASISPWLRAGLFEGARLDPADRDPWTASPPGPGAR